MFAKIPTMLVVFATAVQVAVATPPACLIAAVNTQPIPSEIQSVCSGSNATQVEEYICKNCGGFADTAFKAFVDVCSGAGVTVSASSCSNSTSSSSSVASSTGTASLTRVTPSASGSVVLFTTGIATASSGFVTLSTNGTYTAPSTAPLSGATSTATATSGSGSGTGSGSTGSSSSSPSASPSSTTPVSTNAASRPGMEVAGMIALGAIGAMLL